MSNPHINPNIKEALSIIDEEVTRLDKELSMTMQGHEVVLKEIADLVAKCMDGLDANSPQMPMLKMMWRITTATKFDEMEAESKSTGGKPW